MTTNPLKSFFTDLLVLVLFIAKPALYWMFGLSFHLSTTARDSEVLRTVAIGMFTAQLAAYGHLQTLTNLVDEWSPVMWWGHKEDGVPYCHAGTSDHLLPPVKMGAVGLGIERLVKRSGSGFDPAKDLVRGLSATPTTCTSSSTSKMVHALALRAGT
ncbi:hypothetical protein M405DRAFT_886122 [Rhizopogon salebrosus TDB-379]|nr:hypothetical protein M405DRAFT_886122 [Rhizopogon salebrosus TDB-379]